MKEMREIIEAELKETLVDLVLQKMRWAKRAGYDVAEKALESGKLKKL